VDWQFKPDGLSGVVTKRRECLSSDGLVCWAASGAEHLTQTVLPRGAEVQIMRDRWDHQATIHAGAAYSLDRPEPVCHNLPQEWTAVVDWFVFLPDPGLNLQHHRSLRLDFGRVALPESQDIKEERATT
jgi:hypothetical protein